MILISFLKNYNCLLRGFILFYFKDFTHSSLERGEGGGEREGEKHGTRPNLQSRHAPRQESIEPATPPLPCEMRFN